MLYSTAVIPVLEKGFAVPPYRTSMNFSPRMHEQTERLTAYLRSRGEKENIGAELTYAIQWWHEHRDTPSLDSIYKHYKEYMSDASEKVRQHNLYLQDQTM